MLDFAADTNIGLNTVTDKDVRFKTRNNLSKILKKTMR